MTQLSILHLFNIHVCLLWQEGWRGRRLFLLSRNHIHKRGLNSSKSVEILPGAQEGGHLETGESQE